MKQVRAAKQNPKLYSRILFRGGKIFFSFGFLTMSCFLSELLRLIFLQQHVIFAYLNEKKKRKCNLLSRFVAESLFTKPQGFAFAFVFVVSSQHG